MVRMGDPKRTARRALAPAACLALALTLAPPPPAAHAQATPPAVNPRLPKNVQAEQLSSRAEVLQAQGKWTDAAKLFQQAAELIPEDWTAWDRAGWAHLDANQIPPAAVAFQNAAKGRPAGTPPPGGLLISQFAAGSKKDVADLLKQLVAPDRLAAATAITDKGLAAKAGTPDWNFAVGYLLSQVVRNSGRAVGFLEATAKAAPTRPDVWLLLVEVNRDLDRGPQEDAAALKYLELAPETADAFRIKAERHLALQQYAAATAEYEAGIVKHPAAAELYFQLARAYERGNNTKQAEATLRKLITSAEGRKAAGEALLARTQLAQFFTRTRNYVEAEKLFRELAARPDATAATIENWGSALGLTGKWEEAAKSMVLAVERTAKPTAGAVVKSEDLLAARYRLVLTHLAAGQRAEAKSVIETVLADKDAPRSGPQVELAAFLAWLNSTASVPALNYQRGDERWGAFVWRNKPEEGEFEVRGRFSLPATAWRATLQQIQKRFPDAWPADYALARSYALGGFTTDALTLLKKAVRAREGWWAPHFALGQYYSRQRDRENGIPALRQALKLAPECRSARVYLSLLTSLKEDAGDEPEP